MRALETIHILPIDFRDEVGGPEVRRSLLELLPSQGILVELGTQDWREDLGRTWNHARNIREEFLRQGHEPEALESVFLSPDEAMARLSAFPRLRVPEGRSGDLDLETEAPPPFERDMDRLRAFLAEGAARGQQTLILCDNDGQVQRLEEILEEKGLPPGTCSDPPLRFLTDHEIFRRSRRLKRSRQFRGAASLESLAQLSPGEYVVHMDHGIGVFRGLEHLAVGGEEIEALAIEYAGGDRREEMEDAQATDRGCNRGDDLRVARALRQAGDRTGFFFLP